MTAPETAASERARLWRNVLWSLASSCVIVALAWARRHPEWIDLFYDAGDVLDTHKNGILTHAAFHQWLAHLEIAILAGVFALMARTARHGALAGVVATTVTFVTVFAD